MSRRFLSKVDVFTDWDRSATRKVMTPGNNIAIHSPPLTLMDSFLSMNFFNSGGWALLILARQNSEKIFFN